MESLPYLIRNRVFQTVSTVVWRQMIETDENSIEYGTAVITPSPAEKRAALEEVLQSASFLRADQLRKFLRFICELEISGRAGDLTEYLIGTEALGRPAGYSTAEDSVVRRRAIDLREKLAEVYATELSGAKVRIDLPKGRYIPRFVRVEPAGNVPVVAAIKPEMLPWDAVVRARRTPLNAFWFGALFFTLGAVVASIFFMTLSSFRSVPSSQVVDAGVTYEVEADGNILSGTATRELCDWCSGGARVRRIGNKPFSYVTLSNVNVGASGNYIINIQYILLGSRSFFISVNNGDGIEVPLTGKGWSIPATVSITVALKAGNNTIRFYNDNAYAPDLDRITVR